MAIDLLDDVASYIASGPATQNYRTLVRTNVDKIKADLLDAQTEVTEIAADRDMYAKVLLATVGVPTSPIPFSNLSAMTDTTTLVLINQSSISLTTAAQNQVTRMVIVGNYTPTNLTYSSLTNLESLYMFDGTMTDDVRNAISSLAKRTNNKLRYLEVSYWGTTIAAEAFARTSANKANSIQELVGFEDVTTVGYRAFYYCANLKSVSLPNLTTFAEQVVSSVSRSDTFANCTSLTTVNLPRFETASGYAFYNCSGLTTLSLPNLRTIGTYAFMECYVLQDITLSDNLLSVGDYAFYFTDNVTTLRLVGHTSANGILDSCGLSKLAGTNLKNRITDFYYILGEEVLALSSADLTTYINDVLNVDRSNFLLFYYGATCHGTLDVGYTMDTLAFSTSPGKLIDVIPLVLYYRQSVDQSELGKLQSAVDLTVVGNYTPTNLSANEYKGMTNLERLRMFDGTMTDDLRNAVSYLAKATNNKLRYLEISHWGTTTIATSAFARASSSDGAKSIQELVGFEDVTTVEYRAFYYCTNLKSVSLPNVRTLAPDDESGAFQSCSGLETIFLPKLITIGLYAFYGCTVLQDITLSDNLLSVETNAFNSTDNVTTLRLVGNTSANGIEDSCGMLASTNLNGRITNFYYILGEELRGSSSLTTYINDVLNIDRSNFPLFNSGATCRGYLVLSGLANRTSFSVSSGKLIDTILD
jgi:hypothetical protein